MQSEEKTSRYSDSCLVLLKQKQIVKMIIGKDIQSVWNKHKKDFLILHALENTKKIKSRDLEYRYIDLNGMSYFGFGKDMALPLDRLGKVYHYMELLLKGLSVEEDEAIDTAISKQLELGLTNPKEKSAAKIGALLIEREKRRKLVIHCELLYNLLAVQWIREDEDPSVFSNDIQMQKVDQFMKEVESRGAYPFFQVPELIQLNSFLKMSETEWEQFWQESTLQIKVLKEVIPAVFSSESVLGKLMKTSSEA